MPKNRGTFQSIWALCALIIATVGNLNAQTNTPFVIDEWGPRDGLSKVILSVIQTKDGYLWLGTLKGLVRFDGNHFTKFDQHNTPGLESDTIIHLFEDSQTNLWIGMDPAGVAVAHNGKIQAVQIAREERPGRLTSVCEDTSGGVWLYTDTHLARYQHDKFDVLTLMPRREPGQTPFCRAVVSEKTGALWIGEVSGLFAFHSSGFQPPALVIDQNIPVATLDFILGSARGGVWRLADRRVEKWAGNQREKDFGTYPWGNAPVACAIEDRDGNLIVGTLGDGVFWYDADGKFQHVSTEQGLSSAYVLSLCMDGEGNLWAGTDGGGLNRIKRKVFHAPGEQHSWVARSVAEDKQGGLWMTLNAFGGARGAWYWDGTSVKEFAVGVNSSPRAVLVDRQKRVWVGTSGERTGEGLFQFQTNHFAPVNGMSFPGLQIFALFEDHAGQLWAGTQIGLARLNEQGWKTFTTHDGLSENIITAIAEDSEGNLWVGTENHGLNLFKDGKFISYERSENDLPGRDISCLYADTDGAVWVGTAGNGLGRFRAGKWKHYSTDDGLASNHIAYIVEDRDGYLWIGSDAGLMRIKKAALNDFAENASTVIQCRTYTETDGLPTRECSFGSQPSVCRADDGRIWFPTVNGLVSANPSAIKPNLQSPTVMIESVFIEGREQKTNRLSSAWRQSVVVPPSGGSLEIDYTALNFSAPQNVRFKYWLDGQETTKPEIVTERVARYPKLPPGEYQFHVTACNEDGVWNANGQVLGIIVQPQFWQTWTFRIALVVVILAFVAGSVRYVSTQKLQRRLQSLMQQEQLEHERARIARDLHDQLGANLTQVALLGEMAEDDKDSPEEVISHAQQISQTARETTRSLDEIVWAVNPSNDTLEGLANYACKYAQDYLQMAQLRYRVDVPAELPAVNIPPEVRHNVFLAFKEAVNNVVKHAQATESSIHLQVQPGHFILEVEDNGRGLAGMNTEAARTRNGLRNMRKRMEDVHGQFEILPRAGGGTIVRLTIPLGKQIV